eukprot:TRINITY_DN12308_c0_g1_i2.p2 TRINITY_DN12308_c0_g1~~TRINITY_DN12308_c0_g1_i2.p2  ORF type:complete len:204 (+),score=35.18 TRINITY_DN12308_c0_g1_i2:245-856(+)
MDGATTSTMDHAGTNSFALAIDVLQLALSYLAFRTYPSAYLVPLLVLGVGRFVQVHMSDEAMGPWLVLLGVGLVGSMARSCWIPRVLGHHFLLVHTCSSNSQLHPGTGLVMCVLVVAMSEEAKGIPTEPAVASWDQMFLLAHHIVLCGALYVLGGHAKKPPGCPDEHGACQHVFREGDQWEEVERSLDSAGLISPCDGERGIV